jgi:hypothetical protein
VDGPEVVHARASAGGALLDGASFGAPALM